ncbi:tetrapyrrole (corrin-porphyrin) methylase family protein [Nonlabens tegetincola]|uniref:Tetrapyrrole (Corrin-porphyrin) methylase family protein n=1 Tax=Nonlabens tegetincola TaxID=323273 RepID=A0A090Q4R8_9FLAO|nr:SAM-dependent methyltransferase [Nonlabens tegetincola]GAK97197.1 tetrapyrrole (corrin-porphyrin) methylase family protein [Nonlabens tegetincola]
MMEKGRLFLIPVTLGEINPLEVLPISVKKVIEVVDHYIVENEKSARRFIKSIHPGKSQPSLQLSTLNKFTEPSELPTFLKPCHEGTHVGLMSEAGVPGVADPGSQIVAMAHEQGIRVQPLVGPSSILMAMMSSGMNGQSFAFNGYLPIDKHDRRKRIKQLESLSLRENQSQALIETPYRNNKLIEELLTTLHPETRLCIACDITLPTEYIRTFSVKKWKQSIPDIHKRPALFIIHA